MLSTDLQIDRRTLLEADSLEAAGWEVTILATPKRDTAPDDRRVVRTGTAETPGPLLLTALMGAYRKVKRVLPLHERIYSAVRRAAWRFLVKPEDFYVGLFAHALPMHPAEVFVAQDLPVLPAAVHAARMHGAKVVYDSHELFIEQEFTPSERKMWARIEKRHIRRCDAVITVNPSIARELEKRYGLPRVHVVHNAERQRPERPTRSRRFHDRLGLPADALVLLLQGGLSPGRFIDELVAAMAGVRNPRVHLVVLGDGPMRDTLVSIIERDRLHDRVHLLPAVAQGELLEWTEAADAGVIPYRATCLNNYYCTPNKLFEFIAAGVPVLASDLPEIRRIVTTNGIGRVTDLASPQHMAAAIDEFFSDPQRLEGWREAGRRARSTVNWEAEGRTVVAVFEALR